MQLSPQEILISIIQNLFTVFSSLGVLCRINIQLSRNWVSTTFSPWNGIFCFLYMYIFRMICMFYVFIFIMCPLLHTVNQYFVFKSSMCLFFLSCLNSTTVKRVVYTSSCAAVILSDNNAQVTDESCWSDVDYIKTLKPKLNFQNVQFGP